VDFLSQLFGPPIPNIEAPAAQTKLDAKPKPFLLDVREPNEYSTGHIAGATLIPLGQLTHRINELPRDREIICVCHSGNRSSSATRHLLSQGFTVINLRGGMIGWSHHGLPIKQGKSK